MRSSLLFALIGCLTASVAEAQVEQGSFKFSIDTDLLSYSVYSQEAKDADVSYSESELTLGPGGSAMANGMPGYVALSAGYVAHPHLIPQLHLGFTHSSGESEFDAQGDSTSSDLPTRNTVMIRPELEIPFNRLGGVVGYGLVGFDFRYAAYSENNDESEYSASQTGYGPILGVGLHLFAGPKASFDLSAQFSYLIVDAEVDSEEETFETETDQSISMFSIVAGMSLWP